MFFIPSHIPFNKPVMVNFPSSKATSRHQSTTDCQASFINPHIRAASPPIAAPMPSAILSAIPVQSIAPIKSAAFSPSSCQFVSSKNAMSVSNIPFTSSPRFAPFSSHLKSLINVFRLVARSFPNSDHLKVVAILPIVSKIAFHFAANKCPIPPQSMVSINPFNPSPINFPTESQCVLSRKAFIPAIPVFMDSPIAFPIELPRPSTSTNPFIRVPIDFPIFLTVFCIFSQGMLSRASFSLLPIKAPISVKSASAHAFLIMSASPLI